MTTERWKVAAFSKCRACPYAAWMPNRDYRPEDTLIGENRSRIYVGCNKTADRRGFDADQNIYGPDSIPGWCPLPNAPTTIGFNPYEVVQIVKDAQRRGEL
jgi:hypothetical protein